MQLTVQVISGVLTVAVLALTIIGVLRTRKTHKTVVKRAEPTIGSDSNTVDSSSRTRESRGNDENSVIQVPHQVRDAPHTVIQVPHQVRDDDDPGSTTDSFKDGIISITLLAEKERPYAGYELLQALLSNGLRFGKMDIFHAFENKNGKGKIIFSCASAKKPGTFDIKNMGPFSTPGLTLFIQVSHDIDNAAALDAMLSTAELLTLDLGGVILDDERQLLKDEKISLWQKQIRAFEKVNQELVT